MALTADQLCLFLCDVELQLWDFVVMKLYRKCLVLNKRHFQCVFWVVWIIDRSANYDSLDR